MTPHLLALLLICVSAFPQYPEQAMDDFRRGALIEGLRFDVRDLRSCKEEGIPALKLFIRLEMVELLTSNKDGPVGLAELFDFWAIFT